MKNIERRIVNALRKSKHPLGVGNLSKRAGISRRQRHQLHQALSSLEKKQEIVEKNGRYGLVSAMNLVPATIVKVAATFGFAKPDEEGRDDLFIPGRFLMGSMPGDKVLVEVARDQRGGDLTEGAVFQVVEEENRPFAAILQQESAGMYVVKPDSYVQFSIPVDRNAPVTAKPGDKVLAMVRRRGKRHSGHTVEIIQVFGDADSAVNSAEAILAEHEIYRDFGSEAMEQAQALSSGTGIHPNEMESRLDLREENIFTIDGAATKDIDDAISLDKKKDGWTLGVHIADVSYYVTRNSPLDKEAFQRGTSVYFADQVVPMLPPELSNGICSLNPGEDRLAFSALIDLDAQGKIQKFRFKKTVIRSQIQGVYEEINQIIDNDADNAQLPALKEKYVHQLETLEHMLELSQLLRRNRMARNAINLESQESQIIVENGRAVDIVPRVQGLAEEMIEEFMLTANEAAASFAMVEHLPFIYRVHESPDPDRLDDLFMLLDSLGISYVRPKANQSPAATLEKVLESVKDTDLAGIVNYSILRTMAKAEYSDENQGHFGLSLDNYAHFTSPIRRYPDLAIHRILTGLLTGMRRDNIERYFRNWTHTAATHSTAREIAAMTAERNAEDCYKAEYLSQFVGEEMEGRISSATNFGIFVQLESTVEGLIHTDDFPPGRWVYDGLITFHNDVGGTRLRVGDPVRVRVARVNVSQGEVDFVFAEPEKFATPGEGEVTIVTAQTKEAKSRSKKQKRPAGKSKKTVSPKRRKD